MEQLNQGDDYTSLASIKMEFGYLFDIKDHGLIEALFKKRNTTAAVVDGVDEFYLKICKKKPIENR